MGKRPLPFDPIAEAFDHWTAHGWEAAEGMAAATSIMRAHQIILARLDAALGPYGITFARYEALALLYFSRKGALPLGKMSTRLMVHPTSITSTVDRLEEQGYLERVAHPTDRRLTLATITDEGRSLVEKVTKDISRIGFGIDPFTDTEARRLTRALRPMRLAAGDFEASAHDPWGPAARKKSS